jgi:hypothetical protein
MFKSSLVRRRLVEVLGCVVIFAWGCATPGERSSIRAGDVLLVGEERRIVCGPGLEVKVDESGFVGLPLGVMVHVAGVGEREAAGRIRRAFVLKYFRAFDPKVSIIARGDSQDR